MCVCVSVQVCCLQELLPTAVCDKTKRLVRYCWSWQENGKYFSSQHTNTAGNRCALQMSAWKYALEICEFHLFACVVCCCTKMYSAAVCVCVCVCRPLFLHRCMPNEVDMPASAHTSCYHIASQFAGRLVAGLYGQQTPSACVCEFQDIFIVCALGSSGPTQLPPLSALSSLSSFLSFLPFFKALLSRFFFFLAMPTSCTCLSLSLPPFSDATVTNVPVLVYYYAILPEGVGTAFPVRTYSFAC